MVVDLPVGHNSFALIQTANWLIPTGWIDDGKPLMTQANSIAGVIIDPLGVWTAMGDSAHHFTN
jgi:hypothetical protein